ncbi:hypothetical protein ACFXTO_008590 [Malus domestica]
MTLEYGLYISSPGWWHEEECGLYISSPGWWHEGEYGLYISSPGWWHEDEFLLHLVGGMNGKLPNDIKVQVVHFITWLVV